LYDFVSKIIQEKFYEIKHKGQSKRQDAPGERQNQEDRRDIVGNRELKTEGKADNYDGKVQEKVGAIKKSLVK